MPLNLIINFFFINRRTGETITLSPEDAMKELQKFEDLIKSEGVHEAFPKYAGKAHSIPYKVQRPII